MNETQQELRKILNSADLLLRGVIEEVDRIVSTPTQSWTVATRKHAMEGLSQTAAEAADKFGEWMQKSVWIKNIVAICGRLESIKMEARLAAFGDSRCWGRTQLKQDLKRLIDLFFDGCECEMEIRAEENGESHSVMKYKLQTANAKSSEYLSVGEVANFFNVSRSTIARFFENFPGVIDLNSKEKRRDGRRHRFLRIPRGALNRFIHERRVH